MKVAAGQLCLFEGSSELLATGTAVCTIGHLNAAHPNMGLIDIGQYSIQVANPIRDAWLVKTLAGEKYAVRSDRLVALAWIPREVLWD